MPGTLKTYTAGLVFGLAALAEAGCADTTPAGAIVCDVARGPALVRLWGSDGPAAIHQTEVTRSDFAAFTAATGYVTLAERPDPEQSDLAMGSAVFRAPTAAAPQWWHLDRSANWRTPKGGRAEQPVPHPKEPVRHIAYPDAQAYAA